MILSKTPFWVLWALQLWLAIPGVLSVAEARVFEPSVPLETSELVLILSPSLADGGMGQSQIESRVVCPPRAEHRLLIATLDEPMPAGTSLEIQVVGPNGSGEFLSMVAVGRTLSLLVPATAPSMVALRYRFRHDVTASVGAFARSLIFTLISP